MHPTEGTQVGPEPGASPFTGIPVPLPPAVVIIIPRPFVHAVTDGGMAPMAAPIALPLVGVELGTASRHVVGNEVTARPRIGMITAPKAMFARLPRYHTDDGRTIVGIGSMPPAPLGATAWWVARIAMGGAFFPPRSDTVRRPQRRCHASRRWAPSRPGSPARDAGVYAIACATCLVHGQDARSVHLWPCHGAGAPGSQGVDGSSRTPCRLAGCRSPHRRDNGRRESGLAVETAAARGSYSVGKGTHAGVAGVPTGSGRCCHLRAR
jgi:hypothetical protein